MQLLSPGNEKTSDRHKSNIKNKTKQKTQTINSLLLKWAEALGRGGPVFRRMPMFRKGVAFGTVWPLSEDPTTTKDLG